MNSFPTQEKRWHDRWVFLARSARKSKGRDEQQKKQSRRSQGWFRKKNSLWLSMRVCIIRVVVGVCERLRRGVYPTPLAVHLARVGNENSFRGQSDCRFQPLTTHILPLTRIWFNTKFTRRTVSLFLHNWHFSFITAKPCFFLNVSQCIFRLPVPVPPNCLFDDAIMIFVRETVSCNHFNRMSRILLYFFCDTIPLTTFSNWLCFLKKKRNVPKN
jgi:hypothetical protein